MSTVRLLTDDEMFDLPAFLSESNEVYGVFDSEENIGVIAIDATKCPAHLSWEFTGSGIPLLKGLQAFFSAYFKTHAVAGGFTPYDNVKNKKLVEQIGFRCVYTDSQGYYWHLSPALWKYSAKYPLEV